MSRLFAARYYGTCNDCGAPIEPGDQIGYADDEIVCEDCYPDDIDDDGGDW